MHVKISTYMALFLLFIIINTLLNSITIGKEVISLESQFPNNGIYTVILERSLVSGVFIKSYYQDLKIVGPYIETKRTRLKVSKEIYDANINNNNLSLICHNNKTYAMPLLSGACFINDNKLGLFVKNNWNFYLEFKTLPIDLKWENPPTLEFYQTLEL